MKNETELIMHDAEMSPPKAEVKLAGPSPDGPGVPDGPEGLGPLKEIVICSEKKRIFFFMFQTQFVSRCQFNFISTKKHTRAPQVCHFTFRNESKCQIL